MAHVAAIHPHGEILTWCVCMRFHFVQRFPAAFGEYAFQHCSYTTACLCDAGFARRQRRRAPKPSTLEASPGGTG